ncbi:GtrA family protein [Bacillus sp. Marseille-P3661]|uniref:GtrA family protein n=1 Tax=Bacillus sp. Marseille-P3661 TaxID=1936234 RepID=UPI002155EE3A|nr:GtrA family protein [Bacillus sp. Marseille-P3661]
MNIDRTFIRFLLVGLVNTAIGLSVMYILLHFVGISYWLATLTGNSIGACTSFALNRSFTFRSDSIVSKSFPRFVIVVTICYFISYSFGLHLVTLVMEHIHAFPTILIEDSAILVGTCCYTMLNYFGQKQFVFSR